MQAPNIFLSDKAKQDLRDIKQDTYDGSHSRTVANTYLKRIRRHIRFLARTAAAYPFYQSEKGVLTACRFCVAEHHIVYFTVSGQGVLVVRILPPAHRRASSYLLQD